MHCDISDRRSVDDLYKFAMSKFDRIDVLINNAGIPGPLGNIEEVNWDEWVEAININLIGTAYMCRKVIEIFRQQDKGKIINLSGGGATTPLPGVSGYATPKAGLIRFTETLAEENKDKNIFINAIAPGALKTALTEKFFNAGPNVIGKNFTILWKKSKKVKALLLKLALCATYLASDESDGITGKLISARWDPWDNFNDRIEKLKSTDIYTLRRVMPEDRGLSWEEFDIENFSLD